MQFYNSSTILMSLKRMLDWISSVGTLCSFWYSSALLCSVAWSQATSSCSHSMWGLCNFFNVYSSMGWLLTLELHFRGRIDRKECQTRPFTWGDILGPGFLWSLNCSRYSTLPRYILIAHAYYSCLASAPPWWYVLWITLCDDVVWKS